MIHVSFAMTSEAFADESKTEARRFWKLNHARKFMPGVIFMGITKDFRAGGVRMHPARVVFCQQEPLRHMSLDSFVREGGTRYWKNRFESPLLRHLFYRGFRGRCGQSVARRLKMVSIPGGRIER